MGAMQAMMLDKRPVPVAGAGIQDTVVSPFIYLCFGALNSEVAAAQIVSKPKISPARRVHPGKHRQCSPTTAFVARQ
jgi:hypothetical protein